MTNEKRDPAVDEFVGESKEILERVSNSLQLIEKNAGLGGAEELGALYRDLHTIKGTSELFGYKKLGLVGHA